MSKKLQGNGLFESSRMMLPEHKDAYIEQQRQLKKQKKPELDEQELLRISQSLFQSMHDQKPLHVIQFGEFQHQSYYGVVKSYNKQRYQIQIETEAGLRWLALSEIINVFDD